MLSKCNWCLFGAAAPQQKNDRIYMIECKSTVQSYQWL